MASLVPWLCGRRGGGFDDPWFSSPFSSSLRDPFDFGSIAMMRRGGGGDCGDETLALAHANVDWQETESSHIFRADLPGVRREELNVQVEDDNILQISGERVKEEEDKNDKWHRVERRCGSFMRRFRLRENAKLEDIKCSLENGVLTVNVPKKETHETQKNVRYIDIA